MLNTRGMRLSDSERIAAFETDSLDQHACVRVRFTEAHLQHKLVFDHVAQLRNIDSVKSAMVVLGIESNLGFEAQHTVHALQRSGLTNCCPIFEGVDNTLGMLTTNKTKEVMCTALGELLSLNRLHVSSRFVSVSTSPKEMLSRFLSEMRAFMVYVDAPRSLFVQSRRTFTGKVGGHQDDAVIALQMSVLCMQYFLKHNRYDRFR